MIGISHHTAALEQRERLAIPGAALPEALRTLSRSTPLLLECAILSTCNRIELYLASSRPTDAFAVAADFFARQGRLPVDAFRSQLYRYDDREAVRHLFRVTAGLDSMILGEPEIMAQVKQAYAAAQAAGTTGPRLHRLFQRALRCAKLIRARTALAQGQASIGSVVVALAQRTLGDLSGCRALLWGAGKAAETTARHLVKAGVAQLWVVNRTQTKAQDLALICRTGWLSWQQALAHLATVDIAVVCTQAPHYVIDPADLAAVRRARGGRPLLIIDLAVPRNVDPAVAVDPLVRLHNIDRLQGIADSALATRHAQVGRCETLITEQVARFAARHGQQREAQGSEWWMDPVSVA